MKLNNKTYDTLKMIALIGTPVITFLAALCTIWQVPHCSEINCVTCRPRRAPGRYSGEIITRL